MYAPPGEVVGFLTKHVSENFALLLSAKLNAGRERTLELQEGAADARKKIQPEPGS